VMLIVNCVYPRAAVIEHALGATGHVYSSDSPDSSVSNDVCSEWIHTRPSLGEDF